MEEEIRLRWPPVKQCLESPEAERGKEGFSFGASGENSALLTP